MNRADLENIVRAQSQQIRNLQEQTNRSIRHLAHLVRDLQAGNHL